MKNSVFGLLTLVCFIGCEKPTKTNLTGLWANQEEKIQIVFRDDSTFSATNVPSDIENCEYLKRRTDFVGTFTVVNNSIKLQMVGVGQCAIELKTQNFGRAYLRLKLKSDVGGFIDLVKIE